MTNEERINQAIKDEAEEVIGEAVLDKLEDKYIYQVGDAGLLENGIDTYRITANDAMLQDGSTYLAALVVVNSSSNEGYVNIKEQGMGFSMEGRHPLDYQFGGDIAYNLTPPGTTAEPEAQAYAPPSINC